MAVPTLETLNSTLERDPISQTSHSNIINNNSNHRHDNLKSNSVWWINGAFVVFTHIVALLSILFYTPHWQTIVLTYICWQLATLGITLGYHRLWSHKAYDAPAITRFIFLIMGTLGFQGSCKWWVARHRLHHRFTDTEDDPYSATKGFWFSHMGWIFEKPFYPKMKLIDMSDLNSDPLVRLQHQYYPWLAFFFSFIAPTMIGSLWSDSFGAYLYAGFVARVLIWHVTFCINSFAHYVGDQPYGTSSTARGGLLLALVTNGEGNHNFHHEFPFDYRNGVSWLDWDPTKWIIWCFSLVGLTYNLRITHPEEIEKAKLVTIQQKIETLKAKYNWGPSKDSLPSFSLQQVKQKCANEGKEWIIIDDFVVDVSEFKIDHPGGLKLLKAYYGKDASVAFHGGSNIHSQSAVTLMNQFLVGRIFFEEDKKKD